jgi:hypothetical protein
MPWVDSSSEAPSHLREPIGFLPSLAKVIVSPDVFMNNPLGGLSFEAASPKFVEAF